MKNTIEKICISLLIILWVYTAGSKLLEFNSFKHQLFMQHFSFGIENILVYALPITELFTAFLLCKKQTLSTGLTISIALLSTFTIYIALILTGLNTKAPCSCGGVLNFLNWKTHLIFNLTLVALNAWVIYHHRQKRKEAEKISNNEIQ
ncbi:MauE/DoxX family redox-associated membrane protein [Pedobacter frigidisoli]|uniref:MauE/DoxX family redox-associated membrane protein n=1 Tax=Pedobacter frigidisoli TaxID=2530455 RepID=UPI00293037BE|nr:MauE/DoxX family redox-associated membrane protein [Pedobacter frigidisoli]